MSNESITDLIELLGYAPDADPNVPGAVIDCSLMIPNHRGMQTPRIPGTTYWQSTAAITVSSSAFLTDAMYMDPIQSGFVQLYLGLYDSVSGSIYINAASFAADWQDVTPTSGTVNSLPTFEQFGNYALMANGAFGGFFQRDLSATMTTPFSEVTYAPRMTHLVVAQRFVLGFNGLITGGGTSQYDAWQCSARDDHTSWTVSPATLCTTGRLADAYGEITGAIAFNNDVYAFKYRTCYRGQFTGPPEVWTWTEWPFGLGAVCAPKRYKRGFLFLAADDLYFFDGASLTPLMDGRLRYLYGELGILSPLIVVDELHDLVYVNLANTPLHDSLNPDWYVCHIPTRKWGRAVLPGVLNYFAAPFTNAGYGPNTLWALDTGGSVRRVSGDFTAGAATGRPFLTLNDFGDAFADTELAGVRTKLITSGGTSTATPQYRDQLDATLNTGQAVPREADGLYEVHQNARWHRVKLEFTDATEVTGVRYDFREAGQR